MPRPSPSRSEPLPPIPSGRRRSSGWPRSWPATRRRSRRRSSTPRGRSISPDDETEFLSAVALKAGLETEMGETEEAKRTLDGAAAARGAPRGSHLALEVADLQLALGDAEAARDRLRLLCEGSPTMADAWYALGCAAEQLEDDAERRSAWKRTWTLDAAPGDGGEDRRLAGSGGRRGGRGGAGRAPRPGAGAARRGSPSSSPSCRPKRTWARASTRGCWVSSAGTAHGDGGTALGGQPGLTQIVLFRRNLERAARDEDELREEIRSHLAARDRSLLRSRRSGAGGDGVRPERSGDPALTIRSVVRMMRAQRAKDNVANIKSSEKANRQRVTRTARNVAQKTAMRTAIKKCARRSAAREEGRRRTWLRC